MIRTQKAMDAELAEAVHLHRQWTCIKKQAQYVKRKYHTQGLMKAMGEPFRQTLLHVYALTLDEELCEYYSVYAATNWSGFCAHDTVATEDIQRMLSFHGKPERLQTCVDNVDSDYHFKAAKWLAEWEVVIDLCCLNAKGVTPPGHHLITIFQKSFRSESKGVKANKFLEELHTKKWRQDKWLTALKSNWLLAFKTMPARPPLNSAEITRKERQSPEIKMLFKN